METITPVKDFIENVTNRTCIYNSLNAVIKKSSEEGYLQCAHLALDSIFNKEIEYAVDRFVIRVDEGQAQG